MKKIFFLLCCVFYLQIVFAQRSIQFISPDRLFYEGKAMFENKNYAGCLDKIRQYKEVASNPDLLQESDYLLAASDYYRGSRDITIELKEFLENYPASIHRNEVAFMIGSVHFAKGDYHQAIFWLNESDIDYLTLKQQEDYAYRMALSSLKTGNNKEALRLFSLLRTNSAEYKEAATYYLAYLHYTSQEYNDALLLFNQLKNNKEFQPEVLYYISQINYIQKRYAQTITEGTRLLNTYPNNSYNTEINRIVGISYYHEEDYAAAVKCLNRFLTLGGEADPEDYYILGLSCFMQHNDSGAIEYLGLSNPGNTKRGQSTYLYLGQAFLNRKDYPNALRAFESASRMDFDPQAKEAAMYNYAMLLNQNSVSAFGESVTVLENFLNTYPNSIYSDKVNDALVEVYLTTKNYETALASIDKIKKPGNKILEAKQKIYYYLGTIAFTNNDFSQASHYFTLATDAGNYAYSEKNLALYWRGEAYYKQEDYIAAIRDYNVFLQTGNNEGNLRTLANYNIAYCFFKQKQYKKAESYFQAYINEESNKTSSLADAYIRLGDCYFYNRQFNDAEKAYDQAISILPSIGDYALFQKGFVLGLLKNYNGKIVQMDRLIRDYPNSPYVTDALYEKGRSYVMMDNNSAAISAYHALIVQYPNSNAARNAGIQTGLLYFNMNQLQESADAYKDVVAKYPGSEEAKIALQDLKSVYFEMNDVSGYADYVRSLGNSTRFDVSEQDSLTYLAAERFFTKGDINQAQTALKNYLQSFPNGAFHTNAHYYLANTYYQQKKYEEAKKEYSRVLDAGDTRFTEEAVARTAELQYRDQEYAEALLSYQRLQTIAASKGNKEIGSLGIIRSAAQLKKQEPVVVAANRLLDDKTLNPEIATEVRYFRAKAYLDLGENTLAVKDLEELAKDTRTVYGAEAKYLLAQYYFDKGRSSETKIIVQDYIQNGTPHQYWLARSFILLSDVYIAEKDLLQARQYLESLQNNYKNTDDDIHRLIDENLSKIKK